LWLICCGLQVQFLHEDEIVQGVQSAVEKLLLGANASRVFYTQQLIVPSTSSSRDADVASIQFDTAVSSPNMEQPSGQIASQSTEDEPEPAAKRSRPAVVSLTSRTPVATAPPETVAKPKYVPSKLVRTDASNPQGRLDSFIMRRPNPSSSTGLPESNNATDAPPSAPAPAANIVRKKADRPPVMLISVHDLIDALERRSSDSLTDVFQQHTFVGCIDDMFALIQCRTKLFLIDVCALSKSFFFEQALRSFSCLPRIELDTAASIDRLVRIALDSPYVPEAADYDAATKSDMAQKAATLLSEKADMLLEYFSIDIRSGNGRVSLVGLPQLLDNYEPPLLNLPLFLLRLATEVNWNDERACFENIAQELALFYQVQPGMYLSPTSASSGGASERISQLVELQLLPQMRFNFSVPSAHSSDGSLVQIACLEQLYKIFERC
jgi:DNA mismatch repair protein MLH1